jgi:hypothetical protein
MEICVLLVPCYYGIGIPCYYGNRPMLLWKSSHVTMEMVVITIWFTDTSNPYIKK